MDSTLSFYMFLGVCFVFGCAYLAWRESLRKKMGEKGIHRAVHCRIYYMDRKLWEKNYVPGRMGIRFGFSEDSKYRNDVKLGRILEAKSSVKEKDLIELSVYETWFGITEQRGKLWIAPAYLPGENVMGHKKVHTDQGLLKDDGEELGRGKTIYGSKGKDSGWKILIYDEFYYDTDGEEEEA